MQTVAIIGANRGIGLALAQHHAARGDQVVACCRHGADALNAACIRTLEGIDVTDGPSLNALARTLGLGSLDRLIINAGILSQERLDEFDEAAATRMLRQFEVNAIGPLRVAAALRGCLKADAKLGIMSSRMGSISDNSSGGYYGYRASKAAVNAIGRSLALDLAAERIAVIVLHPGYVKTDMTGHQGEIEPTAAAAGIVRQMDALELSSSGSFSHANGSPLPW